MDVPFLIVGGHIFRDSDLTATEKEQWIAYIVFISVKLQNRCIYISILGKVGDRLLYHKLSESLIC